ncbi:hypothetical protein EVAR_652_1 [Eumeta japonica]|uniref:Uncharacterized protein n=1 Tax=Eumeta variegata TaxID=151549 RepID=A0A4C1SC78_EUMVA|nr:hypothetical protein EVAR_652_1 [Eumeta japonica]
MEGREEEVDPFKTFTERKATAENAISRLHSVRVWYLNGRFGPLLCCSEVSHSISLPQLDLECRNGFLKLNIRLRYSIGEATSVLDIVVAFVTRSFAALVPRWANADSLEKLLPFPIYLASGRSHSPSLTAANACLQVIATCHAIMKTNLVLV